MPYEQKVKLIIQNTSKDSFLSNDATFINDKLLKGKFKVDLRRYDTVKVGYCFPERLNKQKAIQEFEGSDNIGDIDKNGQDDYVFVLSPINYCEEGQSYYFSNPKIPRIYTDSYCCHPQSIFSIGDIDEDGSNEIGQYYSSCASRYKTIYIWTLKKGNWEKIGEFSYVVNDEYKMFVDFKRLVKKISKNKFKFLEISDINAKGELVKNWRVVTMK